MKNNKEVLKIAKKYIGQGGSRFRKYCGLPSGSAWCNAYVDYIAHEGGVSSLYFAGKKETYCPNSIKWCRKNLAEVPPYLAMPMDIIYFDWEKNGVPNHIGFVEGRISTSKIKTIEGNTNGGIVAEKVRNSKYIQAIYRPHYAPESVHLGVIKVDGIMGYETIANLQQALLEKPNGILSKGTITSLQSKFGAYRDGIFGVNTAKAIQKAVGVKQDGAFGIESVKALQRWTNKMNAHTEEPEPATPIEKTKAEKIIEKINEYAYPYGTSSKKYKYKGGSPKSAYKTALKKYLEKRARISQSDCGYFVSTCVRGAGVSKSFLALRGRKESFPKVPSTMKIVHKGKKIPSGLLKAGDIIRYKKSGGGQHTLFYYGNGKIAEAGRKHYFPAIKKDTKKYNKSNVKKSTIQVIRAK